MNLNGKKTYIAALLLLGYQLLTGDAAGVLSTVNDFVGPVLMLAMRWVTKKTTQAA